MKQVIIEVGFKLNGVYCTTVVGQHERDNDPFERMEQFHLLIEKMKDQIITLGDVSLINVHYKIKDYSDDSEMMANITHLFK
jgi:hypothetical protein